MKRPVLKHVFQLTRGTIFFPPRVETAHPQEPVLEWLVHNLHRHVASHLLLERAFSRATHTRELIWNMQVEAGYRRCGARDSVSDRGLSGLELFTSAEIGTLTVDNVAPFLCMSYTRLVVQPHEGATTQSPGNGRYGRQAAEPAYLSCYAGKYQLFDELYNPGTIFLSLQVQCTRELRGLGG